MPLAANASLRVELAHLVLEAALGEDAPVLSKNCNLLYTMSPTLAPST